MPLHRPRLPIALTIAGSDSGGGAGIQADLKTFAALRVHGTSVVTCLTAQNPRGVSGVQAATPRIVQKQLEAVFSELTPQAIKTGMLFSSSIIRTVADCLTQQRELPLIVDPVMVATSGARLLQPRAVRELRNHLLPRAALVTPNLDEAELLLDRRLRNEDDLKRAAWEIFERYGCAVLVKGGHLRRQREAVDIFCDGRVERRLAAPFVRGISTHGTGCTYSAAIAAHCARGHSLFDSVQLAKRFITHAIATSQRIGRHHTLNWI
jgi:hydroxymethylpyrimidine kinase/phosphomethylpyrimidine kinase